MHDDYLALEPTLNHKIITTDISTDIIIIYVTITIVDQI